MTTKHPDLLESAINYALQKGVPKDVLEGVEEPADVYDRKKRWDFQQGLIQIDEHRRANGLRPLRDMIAHNMDWKKFCIGMSERKD